MKNKTVLVISDMHEQFAAAASMLRDEGHKVLFESQISESLPIDGAEAPNLIISELAVPNVDGLKLCRQVRKKQSLSTTPILLVGDLSRRSSIVEDGFRCGAAAYFEKPLDPVKLVDVCRLILSPGKGENLQKPDNLFNALMANITDVITVVDADDGTILFGSASTTRMFGHEPEELIGRSFFELIHPADVDEVVEYLDSIRWSPANAQPVGYRFLQHDLSWKLVESTGSPFIGSPFNDERAGAAVIITSKEIAEKEFPLDHVLRDDAVRAAIFDSTNVGLAIFSSSGHLVESNAALRRLFDYSENELRNMALSEFIYPYDEENDKRAIAEVFDGRRLKYKFENGYLKPTGERVWGNLTIVSLPDNDSCFLIGIFDEPTTEDADVAFLRNSRQREPKPKNNTTIADFNGWKVEKRLICEN